MRKPKVLIDFSHSMDSELDQQAQAIVLAMTGNTDFPVPSPTLADVTTAIGNYQDAMNNAATGDHTAIEIKDQRREDLEKLLHQLGLYVETQSGGDAAVMLSSGFHISKTPSPVGPLPKPTGFQVLPQGKGEIKLVLDRMDGAKSYEFEYKLATDTNWIIKITTKTKILLTELESGKEHVFRVVPIGASDIREYSDEISSFVL